MNVVSLKEEALDGMRQERGEGSRDLCLQFQEHPDSGRPDVIS